MLPSAASTLRPTYAPTCSVYSRVADHVALDGDVDRHAPTACRLDRHIMRDDLRSARQVHDFAAALVDAGQAAAPVGRAGCLAESRQARQAQQAAGCRLRYRRSGRGRGLDRTGRCSRFASGRCLGRTCGRARAIARCGIVYPLDSVAQDTLCALVQTAQDGDALDLVIKPRQLACYPFQRRLSGIFDLIERHRKRPCQSGC